MKAVMIACDDILIEDVFPYTRARKEGGAAATPSIVIKNVRDGERYYLCGFKNLWSLLDRVMKQQYYRRAVKDELLNGPPTAFADKLEAVIRTAHPTSMMFHLCEKQADFVKQYGHWPMADTRIQVHENIICGVTTALEHHNLQYLLNLIKDNDLDWVYQGLETYNQAKDRSTRNVRSYHLFSHSKQRVPALTARLRIGVAENHTTTIESWVESDEGWATAAWDKRHLCHETNGSYLGPLFCKVDKGLRDILNIYEGQDILQQTSSAAWDRLLDKGCKGKTLNERVAMRHHVFRLTGVGAE